MADTAAVRLCVIGAGRHASRNIYPNFHRLRGARVVANADLDEAKGRAVAQAFGIPRTTTDWRRMVEAEEPDGVLVCIGPSAHERLAPELLAMGLHVYTEKPHATSLAASRRILAAQRASGKVCMVAFKKRFAPAYVQARAAVGSEEFGRPLLLTMLRTTGSRSEEPSDYLLHWGCHATDLVHYLFGPVERVAAATTAAPTLAYTVNLGFANGAVGNLAVSNRVGGCWEEVSLVGSRFARVVVRNSVDMVRYQGDQPVAAHWPSFSHGACDSAVEQGFVGELQEFVDAIRERREPESSIPSATHTLAIHEAIERSVREGQAAEVEPIEP
ncbi:MAG: Gfo/Idh/MocA family protein [Candidatus Brocadiia bacterium]